jgi:hypothetical protein
MMQIYTLLSDKIRHSVSFLIHPTLPFSYLTQYSESRNGVVSIVNRLRAGEFGFRIPAATGNFSAFKTSRAPPDHPPPTILFNGHHGSFLEVQDLGLGLTTHLHLLPRLRMIGAKPPLS